MSPAHADTSGTYINTSPSEIEFTPTSTQAGATTVMISPYNFETTGSFTLTCSGCIAVPAGPSVSAISPKTGPLAGGTEVVVVGTGFTGATQVSFGGVAATDITVLNDTTLTVLSPAEAAGAYNVTVTTPGGTSASTAADEFTFANPVPSVSGISPTSGSPAGGTEVVVTGSGFTGATKVSFGTVAGTDVTIVDSTTLTVLSPAETAGAYNVTVTAPGGTSASTVADVFTYT